MGASIATSVIACINPFSHFIEDARHFQEVNEMGARGLVVGRWEDELGRLRVWAANIGAHQTGQSSLDFRLRDASHIREQIIRLLQSLLRTIQDASDVLAEDEENDEREEIDELMDQEDAKTEIQELQEGLTTTIDCLFQMSILVRKPAQHDLYLESKSAEIVAFEPYDYKHVRERFPMADDALVKRLGAAITRRRKYLKYRERHAMKLRQGITKIGLVAPEFQDIHGGETVQEGIAETLSDTVATNFQLQGVELDDNVSDSDVSQTSYTPTPLSGGNITIPSPPKRTLGGAPFECPYCFYMIAVHGTRSWNKHVFRDLLPYICVAPTCVTPDKLYPTKHEWLHHSRTAHPTVNTDHNAPQNDSVLCSLCMDDVGRGKQYDRHLARHLQELALFILPRSDEDSNMSESNSDLGKANSNVSEDIFSEMSDSPLDTVPTASENLYSDQSEGQEDIEKAEYKYLRTLAEKEKTLGLEDISTLQTVNMLGELYWDLGEMKEAENMYLRVLVRYEKTLGPEHTSTLNVISNLGMLYLRQGKRQEAFEMYQRVLLGLEKVSGPGHLSMLHQINRFGNLYREQGQMEEAERLYLQALTGYEKALGPEHTSTLNVILNLGGLYSGHGKMTEAEAIYPRASVGYEKAVRPEHIPTLSAAKDQGDLYLSQDSLQKAESMYLRALAGFEKAFGVKHTLVLDCISQLGDVYRYQGQMEQAASSYWRALKGFERGFGPEYKKVLELRSKLDRLDRLYTVGSTSGKAAPK